VQVPKTTFAKSCLFENGVYVTGTVLSTLCTVFSFNLYPGHEVCTTVIPMLKDERHWEWHMEIKWCGHRHHSTYTSTTPFKPEVLVKLKAENIKTSLGQNQTTVLLFFDKNHQDKQEDIC
jgi:hypothetical protein